MQDRICSNYLIFLNLSVTNAYFQHDIFVAYEF